MTIVLWVRARRNRLAGAGLHSLVFWSVILMSGCDTSSRPDPLDPDPLDLESLDTDRLDIGAARAVTFDGAHNAFPSIALLPDSSLFLVYRKGRSHRGTRGHIVARQSRDRGTSWGEERVLFEHPDFDLRDPSLTSLSNGEMGLSFFRYNVTTSAPTGVRYSSSSDGGQTWRPDVAVLEGPVATSSPVVEQDDGLFLLPVYEFAETGTPVVSLVSSPDRGQTWVRRSVVVRDEGEGQVYTEAAPSLLGGERLMLLVREEVHKDLHAVYSDDGGVSWTLPQLAIRDGWGGPSLLTLSDGRLLASFRATSAGYPIGVALGTSDGQRWGSTRRFEAATGLPDTRVEQSVYAEAIYVGDRVLMAYGVEGGARADIRVRWIRVVEGT